MIKYKIIDKYSNQQISEFYKQLEAEEYLKRHQKIGKIGQLKGKPIFKIRIIDTDKQRLSSMMTRNRLKMRKEWFGV